MRAAATSIAQTTDGYIWIGTYSGIKRFDGVRFVDWAPEGGDILRTARISSLFGARDGTLLIGTELNGFWKYSDRRVSRLPLSQMNVVWSIVQGRTGTIWAASESFTSGSLANLRGGICALGKGTARCFGESDGLPAECCFDIAEDSDGYLWMSTRDKVFRWRFGSSHAEPAKEQLRLADRLNYHRLTLASDGNPLVGSLPRGRGAGLQHLEGGIWKPLQVDGFSTELLGTTAIFVDSHHMIWIGTENQGLYRVGANKIDHFGSEDGFSGGLVSNIFEDREGNVWTATTKGVDCFRDLAVVTTTWREGLSGNEVDSIFASSDGTVWVGGNEFLNAVRDHAVRSWTTSKGLPGRQVTSIFEDSRRRLLIGIDRTLSILDGDRFEPVKRSDGQSFGFVSSLARGGGDTVWAITSGPRELLRLDNLRVKETIPEPQIPPVRRAAVNDQGEVWLGSTTGDLARMRRGKIETFPFPREGTATVTDLLITRDGTVWGATPSGMIGWRQGKQSVLSTRNGLPCNWVNSIIEDRHQTLWLYTQCGLIEIPQTELKAWWDAPGGQIRAKVLDELDGVQPGIVSFRGATEDTRGRLWFTNGFALQMFDPDHRLHNGTPPPVHVEEITVAGKAFQTNGNLTFPPGTRDLSIRYTGLSFVSPNRVLFRYTLEGQDTGWHDAGTRREAFYTNLAPRQYRFRVIACNNDGVWNEVGDSVTFTVAPSYYQTRWFAFLCAIALIATLWCLHHLQKRQAQLQMEARVYARHQERERISRELHDTLLQGFHGLILKFQAVLKQMPAHDPTHDALEAVLDRADVVLAESRKSVGDLRSDRDQIDLSQQLLRSGEELAESYAIDFSFDQLGTPLPLNLEVSDQALRIVNEALVNAFQHSEASRIETEIAYSSSELRISVRDNGIGISEAVAQQGRPGHWGLRVMRERAARVNARLEIWSVLNAGTEVQLRVPARWAYVCPQRTSMVRRMANRIRSKESI